MVQVPLKQIPRGLCNDRQISPSPLQVLGLKLKAQIIPHVKRLSRRFLVTRG